MPHAGRQSGGGPGPASADCPVGRAEGSLLRRGRCCDLRRARHAGGNEHVPLLGPIDRLSWSWGQ
eukprot:15444556-Alexandrium_andersonii.AAC.1